MRKGEIERERERERERDGHGNLICAIERGERWTKTPGKQTDRQTDRGKGACYVATEGGRERDGQDTRWTRTGRHQIDDTPATVGAVYHDYSCHYVPRHHLEGTIHLGTDHIHLQIDHDIYIFQGRLNF